MADYTASRNASNTSSFDTSNSGMTLDEVSDAFDEFIEFARKFAEKHNFELLENFTAQN